MSAAAIPIYKLLVAKGVGEDEARAAAEAVVAESESRLAENLQAAKAHADDAVAKSERSPTRNTRPGRSFTSWTKASPPARI